jgi:hypothetical protein
LRQRGTGTLAGPLRTATGFALHEGLQSAGAARLMGMTASVGALGSGDGDTGGPASEAVSTDPDDGGLFTTPADMHDALMADGGIEPRPKGPKPIVGWNESSDDDAATGAGVATSPGDPDAAVPAAAARPEAWKWEGVPPGRKFLYPVEPGKHRFYIDYDAQGPRMVGLPPAWPTDGADAEADG